MRIVIDLQGAQTESRFRGIGRYSLSLAKAVVRNRGGHEIIIVLSGLFPDTIESIRREFDALLPQENIRVWYAPGPVRECEPGNEWRREAAKLIREAFLVSLKPDIVHISSLFEGYEDNALTSIGAFDQKILVSVTLYDLIPLLNPDHYLKPNPAYEQFYLRKIEDLKRSSLLLAISDFTRREGIEHLGIDASSIVNISTAVDDHFHPAPLSEKEEVSLRNKFGLTRSVVLYTGGADERKNLPRLILAYSQLSSELRRSHQLVFAGKIPKGHIKQLQEEAKSAGLKSKEIVFTGYVTDEELTKLYNLCKLYVFPSWHEGFGLPALEAMSCGAPVIGANTTSLPEVIKNKDALFDPYSVDSIHAKIEQVLTNEAFRLDLISCGLEQHRRFSWDESARRAITAFEGCYSENSQHQKSDFLPNRRLKLAYVSPLPPERTGIADYSSELLPELSRHYDIDVIVTQSFTSDSWIKSNCKIRDVDWFRSHADHYDRVLYHFGNSPFHVHMFALLAEVPGTVVMHDFFLSSIQAWGEGCGLPVGAWPRELYNSHGYSAVIERYHTQDMAALVMKYPVNLSVLQDAQGVIVHSKASQRMATQWYGACQSEDWAIIPLLRVPASESDRGLVRRELKLGVDDFIVCSFGFLAPTKLNHRLLEAWLNSSLAGSKKCTLIFVGENDGGDYGQEILDRIHHSGLVNRVHISGWVDMVTFRKYLVAADVAVQLRTQSRGETSAAVLDCMNYALPTIVNANGSMFDLPDNGVWKLADEFSDDQLIEALETLWSDKFTRDQLGVRAQNIILKDHSPRKCADQYFEAIERFNSNKTCTSALIHSIASIDDDHPNKDECIKLAQIIAENSSERQPSRQILLDVSATYRNDLKTGIERVARSLLLELIKSPPAGYRIEPVYLADTGGRWHYRYARVFTLGLLNCPIDILADEEVEYQSGDIVLGLDLLGQGLVDARPYLDKLHRDGVLIHFLVFDLLPVLYPQFFPPGAEEGHANWLRTITRYDGAICISNAVADELSDWVKHHGQVNLRPFKISWFHLGADIENSLPSRGLPADADTVLKQIQKHASFLMVGTIEPRKGYAQTLAAFEQLWAQNVDVNLIIVGSEGWKALPEKMRRTIPEIVGKLRHHPEFGKRFIWLEGVSDEYLERIYAVSTCLIAASEGEGFGLPLIEAAQHKIPIIARDIPVFREVAGGHAFYFCGLESGLIAQSLMEWLALYEVGKAPNCDDMPWLSWQQSAQQLMKLLLR